MNFFSSPNKSNQGTYFWFLFSLLIIIPHTTNIGFDISRFTNLRIGNISIFIPFIIIIIMFGNSIIYFLKNKKIFCFSLAEKVFFVWMMIEIVYVLIGYKNYGILSIQDYITFLFHKIIFISGIILYKYITVEKFIKYSMIGLIINGFILLLIKFIFSPLNIIILMDSTGNRFGVANQSLYIFSICYLFIVCLKDNISKIKKTYCMTFLIIMVYLVILNASRSIMGFIFLSCFLIFLFTFNKVWNKGSQNNLNRKYYFNMIKNVTVILFGVISILVFLAYFKEKDSYIYSRIINTFTNFNNDGSLKSRELTNFYYKNMYLKNPFGYGYGIFMPLIEARGFFYQLTSFYSDHALQSILLKSGPIPTFLFILFIFIVYYYNIYLYKRTKKIIYLVLLVSIPFILFNCTLLCSQIIHAVPIYTFFYIYCATIITDYKKNKFNICI